MLVSGQLECQGELLKDFLIFYNFKYQVEEIETLDIHNFSFKNPQII